MPATLAPNPVIDAPAPAPAPPPAAPAPKAAPTPAPKAATPPPERSALEQLDDMGDKLDGKPPKAPEKKVAPPKEEKAPEEDLESLDEDKEPESKETPKEAPKEAPKVEGKKTAWSVVHEKEKALKERDREIATLKEEIAKVKTSAPKPADDPEKIQLAKRLAELEDEIRFTNYEKSTEYQEQYHKPYLDTVQNAIATVTELTVTHPETGERRQATDADFWSVMQARNAEEAFEKAEALFGEKKAAYLMNVREQVRSAHAKAEKAKAEFRTKGTEREKQFREEQSRKREAEKIEWQQANEEAAKKFPQYFTAEEGDAKGKEILEKGFKTVDQAFEGKGNPKLNSSIRMKAGAFNYLAHRLKGAESALKAAEAKIAEYEQSLPGDGSPAPSDQPKKEDTVNDLLDRMARG